jgi:hypothetical protein
MPNEMKTPELMCRFFVESLKPTSSARPISWGVKNSFFTKRMLLFINNLQIFGKTDIFVPVCAFHKAKSN